MSYDVYTDPPSLVDWNYTYNVQPMLARAGLRSLNDLSGVPTGVAALALTTVIERMTASPNEYRALNPLNGWGDYDSFLPRLRKLRDDFTLISGATVRVG